MWCDFDLESVASKFMFTINAKHEFYAELMAQKQLFQGESKTKNQ